MGNNNTINSCGNSHSIYTDYEYIEALGEGRRLLQNKTTGTKVIAVQHTFASQDILKDYLQRNQALQTVRHQYYLNALHNQIVAVSSLCGKQFKMIEYYPYLTHTLLAQITERAEIGRYFTTEQLMSILCSCVLAMSNFCKQDILHYALTPEDILVDQEGNIKIVHSNLSKYRFDFNYQREFYYAPETLRMLAQPALNNCLTHKSAVFTLGITILHAITLTPMHHLYNPQDFTINMKQLSMLLRTVEDRQLNGILKKMLKLHTYERITFPELEEMIFAIIARKESGRQTEQAWSDQIDHISKLTSSISKIKNGEASQVSDYSSLQPFITQRPLLLKVQHTADILPPDMEDMPQNLPQHLCTTSIDPLVLDEYESPITDRDEDVMLSRESVQLADRVLTQNSNMVNIRNPPEYINFDTSYRHTEDKENSVLSYMHSCKKSEQLKEYVVQETPEGRYEGYKIGGERHGFGSFYYHEGGKYCGEWVHGRMQGRGVLYYSSGKIAYEGEWHKDRLHGYGVLYNQHIDILQGEFNYQHLQLIGHQWIKYEGYFKEDKKQGQGTLYLSNGQNHIGMFQNDQPHGLGQYRNVRGEILKGYWLMGTLNLT